MIKEKIRMLGASVGVMAVATAALLLAACGTSNKFNIADTGGDDRISPMEFERYMLEAIYAEADVDRNKQITFEEWRAANPDADKDKFRAADLNGDGVVTPWETREYFRKEGTLDRLFKKMDTTGDGSLSRVEVDTFKRKLAAQAGSTPLQKLSQATKS